MRQTGGEKGLKNAGEQPNNSDNSSIEVKADQNQNGGVTADNEHVANATVSNASTPLVNNVGSQNPQRSNDLQSRFSVNMDQITIDKALREGFNDWLIKELSSKNAPMREGLTPTENVIQSENAQHEENLPVEHDNEEDDQMDEDVNNEMVNDDPEIFFEPINDAPQMILENDEMIFENDEVFSEPEDAPME